MRVKNVRRMADKFLELQQQMRHNQEDLKDYLRDLDNWENNIKKKDAELRAGDSSNQQKKLPPVRNQGVKEKPKRRKKQSEPKTEEEPMSAKKPQRINSYDYRKWDQFDVDKACAEIDSGGEEKQESSEYETDSDAEREENTRQQKMMQANMEKEKGNAYFKEGKYEEALLCYTRGIEADVTNAILPANSAMALLKLKRFEEAESNCSLSLSLDCTYVKAVARRASARLALGKLTEAKKDFEQVLVLEPSNKLAAAEIKKLDKLQKAKENEKTSAPSNIIHAVQKPHHLRSKKPLKRIDIEEIGMRQEDTQENLSSFVETETQPNDLQETINRIEVLPTDTTTTNENQHKISETSQNINTTPVKKASQDGTAAVPVIVDPPTVPPLPQSSYHLLSDWKKLEKHPTQLVQYFKQIDPVSYPALFKQSMESDILFKILRLLQDHYVSSNEPMFAVVSNLTTVKRFDMNVMFMSSEEKKLVKNLLEHISKNEDICEAELESISKKYGL
ncbi:RNA polymerase II-associated protein 3-like [Anneissia japonica]|uniref:RNA polymerase II-associated protein 3-like n=1 Tax=Anneissia japonica TaxID=1529436 RepID=UPI001425B69A|nr:RNA polymerase II-associated protein 3-like [Anneissia japonica]